MLLEFSLPPYTFVRVPGHELLWDTPERRKCGVYLWCIEYQGALLINYVGQTQSAKGFEGRLWTELSDWRKGRYWTPIDIDQFKQGRRKVLTIDDPDVREKQRLRQLDELQPLYRIVLGNVPNVGLCKPAESLVVSMLRSHPSTRNFLANAGNLDRYKCHSLVEMQVTSSLPLIGITTPIPDQLK